MSHPQALMTAVEDQEEWQPHAAEEFQQVGTVGKIAIGLLGASTVTHLLSTWSDWNTYSVVHRYLGGILAHLDCQPIIVGGVEDHVYLLGALSRTCDAASRVKEVKRGSSLWLKTKDPNLRDFAWQNGYGIFPIGFSQIGTVRRIPG